MPLQALGVDPVLSTAICRFVSIGDVELAHLSALTLCLLFTERSLLAAEAITRYLASNGATICERYVICIQNRILCLIACSSWRIWDMQCELLQELRAKLFLKLLGLSSGYLESVINSDVQHDTDWALRFVRAQLFGAS